jgi:NAD(P)H-hydrate repair Nnr-like enzyme with NAD(P)H-hydrate epimerase domain
VIAYCESLRGELRGAGVKVVTICPGYIDTPLTSKNRYSMPFLMQPEAFAAQAFAAIKAGEQKGSALVARHAPLAAGGRMHQLYLCAGHGGTGGIGYVSRNRTGHDLSHCRCCQQEKKEKINRHAKSQRNYIRRKNEFFLLAKS